MADKLISRTDTSRAATAMALGRTLGPYELYPERESYVETEVYERSDRSIYSRSRTVHRWGATYSTGQWITTDTMRAMML